MNRTNTNERSIVKKTWEVVNTKKVGAGELKKMMSKACTNLVYSLPGIMKSMMELIKAETESQNAQSKAYYATCDKIIGLCESQINKDSVSERDKDRFFQLLSQVSNNVHEDKRRNDEHHHRVKEKLVDGLMAVGVLIAAIFALRNGDGNKE